MNQFSPIFGPEEECWACRRTHPKFLPCGLCTDNCILCGTPLFTTERWQTAEGRGPICQSCFTGATVITRRRSADEEAYWRAELASVNPEYKDAAFRMAVWTVEDEFLVVEHLEDWEKLLSFHGCKATVVAE